MSLLREIQEAAVSTDVPLGTLLRQCKVLAARINSKEFAQWVEKELNGYSVDDELPAYRIVPARALGYFSGPLGRALKNAPIPPSCLPQDCREWARRAFIREPATALEDLVKHNKGEYQMAWPADLVAYLQSHPIYDNMVLSQASLYIAHSALIEIRESVRNRILGFTLDVEKLEPRAGESFATVATLTHEKVNQIFQTHIHGNVGNIALGSTGVAQSAEVGVTAGNLEELLRAVERMGVSAEDVAELKRAIQADGPPVGGKLGSAVAKWLGDAISKVASGVWNLALNTATIVLPRLLMRHYGMDPDRASGE